MGGKLKSTLDLIQEKYGDSGKSSPLTQEEKARIAEVRKTYQAKMAEARILLKGDENLPREIARLEREMEEKVERVKTSKP
jgi:hypothetical protein